MVPVMRRLHTTLNKQREQQQQQQQRQQQQLQAATATVQDESAACGANGDRKRCGDTSRGQTRRAAAALSSDRPKEGQCDTVV